MEDHHVAGGDLELIKGQYYKTEKKMNHYNSKINNQYDSNQKQRLPHTQYLNMDKQKR